MARQSLGHSGRVEQLAAQSLMTSPVSRDAGEHT